MIVLLLLARDLYAVIYLYPKINYAASFPPTRERAASIYSKASAYAFAFTIIASALPLASRTYACFSASAIFIFAIFSPSEVKILALFLLSASAYKTIDF